jgi:hypothetical protein
MSVPGRHAVYGQNLVLLSVLVGGELTGADLFGRDGDIAVAWRSQAQLWRSQLARPDWDAVVRSLRIERIWTDERRDLRLRLADGEYAIPELDLEWLLGRRAGIGDTVTFPMSALRQAEHFSCTEYGDFMNDVLMAAARKVNTADLEFRRTESGRWIYALRALLECISFNDNGDYVQLNNWLNVFARNVHA